MATNLEDISVGKVDFIERHGLWTEEQAEAAERVKAEIKASRSFRPSKPPSTANPSYDRVEQLHVCYKYEILIGVAPNSFVCYVKNAQKRKVERQRRLGLAHL